MPNQAAAPTSTEATNIRLRKTASRTAETDMGRYDDLILRLARVSESPHISPRAAQHKRISDKIDAEYARGNFDRAARWDERLSGWEERLDNALNDVEDNWSEMSGGHAIDDAATGVTPVMAARYAEHKSGLGPFTNRADLVQNLRARSEEPRLNSSHRT